MKYEWRPPAAKNRERRLLPADVMPSCTLCASFRNLSNLLLQIISRDLKTLDVMLVTVLISQGVGLDDLQRCLPIKISSAI